MSSKRNWTPVVSLASLIVGFSLMAVAFGVSASRTNAAPERSHAVGTLKAVIDTVDFLDPQQAYTGQAWWAMWNVYETLVTYKHVDGGAGYRLVPGLAQSMPTVSKDGKTYKFTLRKGIQYSDGSTMKASDFKYAIKRGFLATGQGVGFYTDIVGAEEFSKTLTGDISGIVVNNGKRTITIKLTTRRGDFLTILALIFAAPVPEGTSPAIQNGSIPSSGPYRIINYDPNRGFDMVRNTHFKPTKSIPKGNPDRVEVSLIGDANVAVQRVIDGQADYTNAAIPPDRIATVRTRGQLKLRAAANTYYFWMNTTQAPFNKLGVRRAVNLAVDRKAMVTLVWGGLGRDTQNVLPSTYPSYKKLALYKRNVAKARQMIQAAGANGAKVTVWTRAVDDAVTAGQYYTSVLKDIGLDATLNILPRSTYYSTIGNINTHAQTGWARWLEDYPHPLDWFDVLLNGNRITNQDNNNFAWFNNAKINAEIESLKKEPVLTDAVNARWAKVEKEIMQQAPWAPWSNRVFPEFFTKQMGCLHMQALYGFDLARVCRK